MNQIKPLGCQRGFNLVQVMMATGLLAVVAAGISKLAQQSAQNANYFSAKNNSLGLAQELRSVISNSKLCTPAFLGTALPESGADRELDVSISSGIRVKSGSNLPNYNLHIKRFYLEKGPVAAGKSPTSGNNLYQTKVFLESGLISKANNSGVSGATDTRGFKTTPIGTMIAEVDGSNKIVSCSSFESEADVVEKVCQELGGLYVDGTGCDMTPIKQAMCEDIGGVFKMADKSCDITPKVTPIITSEVTRIVNEYMTNNNTVVNTAPPPVYNQMGIGIQNGNAKANTINGNESSFDIISAGKGADKVYAQDGDIIYTGKGQTGSDKNKDQVFLTLESGGRGATVNGNVIKADDNGAITMNGVPQGNTIVLGKGKNKDTIRITVKPKPARDVASGGTGTAP